METQQQHPIQTQDTSFCLYDLVPYMLFPNASIANKFLDNRKSIEEEINCKNQKQNTWRYNYIVSLPPLYKRSITNMKHNQQLEKGNKKEKNHNRIRFPPTLFWCIYGYVKNTNSNTNINTNTTNMNLNNIQRIENDEKIRIVQELDNHDKMFLPIWRKLRFTKQDIQEIKSHVLSNPAIDLFSLHALSIVYRIHIIVHLVSKHTYVEIVMKKNEEDHEEDDDDDNEDGNNNICIVKCERYNNSNGKNNTVYHLIPRSTSDTYYRTMLLPNAIRQYTWNQVLHPISYYKLSDLQEISQKCGYTESNVNMNVNVNKMKKTQLYQALKEYFENKT